ncbi:MAG: glycosyltransferase family 4 protein [Pseudomonadota bacterium]
MQDQLPNNYKNLVIGYVAPGWPLSHFPNGIVAYIHNLLSGLDAKTQPIIFAVSTLNDDLKDSIIDLSKLDVKKPFLQRLLDSILFRLNESFKRNFQYQRGIAENASKILLGIQQLHMPLDVLEMEESFGTASYLFKRTNIPIVTRLHGPWFLIGPILRAENDWDFKLRVAYEREAIENAHGVTSPSLDVLEKVRQYYDITLPHAQVIPNPVLEVAIEKQWQYDINTLPFILFVGRFDSVKGGDLILESFRLIAQKNTEIKLFFVGPDRGLLLEGKAVKFEEYVNQYIPEKDIKNRIQFLGHCDHERISDLRKNALVTVVCSRYENFPLSLLEALAAGCPTVATVAGGMKEIVIDDYNGLLAESESPKSIAEKVFMLISDPEKMQRLSKNAIEDCKKRFSPEVVAAQTVEYYQSVLARASNSVTKIS